MRKLLILAPLAAMVAAFIYTGLRAWGYWL